MPLATPVSPIAALRRFAQRSLATEVQERCDLCAAPLAPTHQHLLEPAARRIACACDACALLFSASSSGRYRRVPRNIKRWADFAMTDEQWAGLGVPIALAFFVCGTPHGGEVIATYPSPAGPTEAPLPAQAWEGLRSGNSALVELEPDVEALLVNRVNGAREYFRAPIDECYRLVGLIRTRWRGISGGDAVWREIRTFFDNLTSRADEGSAARA